MSNAIAQKNVDTVVEMLRKSMPSIQAALPRHMTPERMSRIAITTIRRNQKLQQCKPISLVGAIVEAAQLGLEIDNRGLAYLVPYKDEVTLIPGYKGLIDLAMRSGRVKSVYAEIVYEGDEFEIVLGTEPRMTHRPRYEHRTERKLGVYAVAKIADADPVFVFLPPREVEKIKSASKASRSGPWVDWEDEMWKKSAIRRLAKVLPLSPELSRAAELDSLGDAGLPQHLGEDVIDIAAEEPAASQAMQAESFYDLASRSGVDLGKLEQFVQFAADQMRQPVESVKANAARNWEKFLGNFDKWSGSRPCPKTTDAEGNVREVSQTECESCADAPGCPSVVR